MLDRIQPDQVDNRPMVQVYGRKKALGAAAAVLLAGVERLKASETMRTARNMPDFHIDLLRLRQNWRLKKVSNTIVGDLSYRTAGSKFTQTGVFEVRQLFLCTYLHVKHEMLLSVRFYLGFQDLQ